VLDEAGDFEHRANLSMAVLEAVAPAPVGGATDFAGDGVAELLAGMDGGDAPRLHALISRHARYTNSAKAKAILADWANWLPKFKKVMPVEYRDALKKLAAATSTATEPLRVR
jgi:glutamate synthase (NADPH/NADH) large chain